jgi:hypothetical protein
MYLSVSEPAYKFNSFIHSFYLHSGGPNTGVTTP